MAQTTAQTSSLSRSDAPRYLAMIFGLAFYWSMADVTRVAYFVSLQAGSGNRAFAAFGAYSAIAAIFIVFLFAKREWLDTALKERRLLVPALSLAASLGVVFILFFLEGEGALLWTARLCASIVPIAWFIIVTFAWGRVFLRDGGSHVIVYRGNRPYLLRLSSESDRKHHSACNPFCDECALVSCGK